MASVTIAHGAIKSRRQRLAVGLGARTAVQPLGAMAVPTFASDVVAKVQPGTQDLEARGRQIETRRRRAMRGEMRRVVIFSERPAGHRVREGLMRVAIGESQAVGLLIRETTGRAPAGADSRLVVRVPALEVLRPGKAQPRESRIRVAIGESQAVGLLIREMTGRALAGAVHRLAFRVLGPEVPPPGEVQSREDRIRVVVAKDRPGLALIQGTTGRRQEARPRAQVQVVQLGTARADRYEANLGRAGLMRGRETAGTCGAGAMRAPRDLANGGDRPAADGQLSTAEAKERPAGPATQQMRGIRAEASPLRGTKRRGRVAEGRPSRAPAGSRRDRLRMGPKQEVRDGPVRRHAAPAPKVAVLAAGRVVRHRGRVVRHRGREVRPSARDQAETGPGLQRVAEFLGRRCVRR